MKKKKTWKFKKSLFKFFFTLPRKNDFLLIFFCLILSGIGIIFIGSASMSTVFNELSDITSSHQAVMIMLRAIIKQAIFLLVSYIAMCVVANMYHWENYRFPLSFEHFYKMSKETKKKYVVLPIILFMILIALFVCLAFPARNGTHAWITIPIGTIQPSEFAKVGMMMLVAGCLCQVRQKCAPVTLVKSVFLTIMTFFLVIWLVQNDFGSAAVLLLIAVICCLIPSDERLRGLQNLVGWGMIAGIVLVFFLLSEWGISFIEHISFLSSYQVARFKVAIDPFVDRFGAGFQVSNSLIAFARGSFFGNGLGSSIQKFGYLPFADSDFIIAVIAEEGGLFMLTVVFVLYAGIIWRLLLYAIKVKKDENKVILCGTAAYLFLHLLFNIGGATAFIPLTGVPLLMLSSGGSSLLSWYLAVGLSQSVIARYRRGEE